MNTKQKCLLIVAHAPSPNTKALRDAVIYGATAPDIGNVKVVERSPLETIPADVLGAQAIILGTTENFGYMSGALKDFFDRIYYPCLEKKQGLPFAVYIRAGQDGTGTIRAIETITSGLKWRTALKPVLCRGPYKDSFATQCEELGKTMAAGLETGLF